MTTLTKTFVRLVLLVMLGLVPTSSSQAQVFVYRVDASADGSKIVVLDGDTFRSYDADLNLLASREIVPTVLFQFWVSPDGERLIVNDQSINGQPWQMWDTATFQTIHILPIDRAVQYIEWRGDGREIAVTYAFESGIVFIDAITGAIARQFDDSHTQFWRSPFPRALWRSPFPRAWSPDGTTFVQVWGAGGDRLSLLDAQTGLERTMYTVDGTISGMNWSFDSRFVALSVYRRVNPLVLQSTNLVSDLVILDIVDGSQVRTEQNFPGVLGTVVWSRFQSQITLNSRGQIFFIDPITGGVINTLSGGGHFIYTPFEGRLHMTYSTIGSDASTLAARTSAMQIIDTITGTHGNIITLVPDPTPERLEAIAAACDAPPSVVNAITEVANAEVSAVASLDAPLTALETTLTREAESIPPACAADLLAVAEALYGHAAE